MKRWAFIVTGLYALILFSVTGPLLLDAFGGQLTLQDIAGVYTSGPFWIYLAVLMVSQAALLVVPVRIASRRPLTRGALWPTVTACGVMAGGLATGVVYSLSEYFFEGTDRLGLHKTVGPTVAIIGLSWAVWVVIFRWSVRHREPTDWLSCQCRALLRGSILELLVAVPTHIAVRNRDHCCAGFDTFVGLSLGIAVMLFSFGPAVFFLFADRWKRLHPDAGGAPN